MMKRLLQKKWFRILLRTAVGGITFVVLGYVVLNWWAAGKKSRVIAEARAAGFPLTVQDFTTDLPPEDQNFARFGIMKAWEDAYAQPESGRDTASTKAIETFQAMGEERLRWALGRQRKYKSKTTDFAFLPNDGSFGKTAESFLAEYDRRHGAVIEELKTGLSLPHARRPLAPSGDPGGAARLEFRDGFGMDSRGVANGLMLRAEAALATGDSAKAAESIVIVLRLGETVGSRGLWVSVLTGFDALRVVQPILKTGIERHQWKAEDLDGISEALARWDIRRQVKRGIESEILMVQVWEGWKEEPERYSPTVVMTDGKPNDRSLLLRFLTNWNSCIPAGWFDLCASDVVRQTRLCAGIAAHPGPVRHWWEEAEKMRKAYLAKGELGRMIEGFSFGAGMLKRGARDLVSVCQILAVCEIERYRLEHGSYPATLEAIPSSVATDPFHGTPFCYGVKDGTFFLYSIGPNGKDDGGIQGRGPSPNDKDWVW